MRPGAARHLGYRHRRRLLMEDAEAEERRRACMDMLVEAAVVIGLIVFAVVVVPWFASLLEAMWWGLRDVVAPAPLPVDGHQLQAQKNHGIPKFVFIKTHKTGSSSITVMLGHALEKRGLKPAVPCHAHLGFPGHFRKPRHNLCGVDPLRFTAAISHIRWSEQSRKTLLGLMGPERPLVFTIVRDPITRFISALQYYGATKFQTLLNFHPDRITNEWIKFAAYRLTSKHVRAQVQKLTRQLHLIGYAFDFGLAKEYTPKEPPKFRWRAQALVDSLDFVLLYEEWDLSMAVLKQRLNLTRPDIAYPHLKASSSSRQQLVIAPETRQVLCEVLWSDCMLYDMMRARFQQQVDDAVRQDGAAIAEFNQQAHVQARVQQGDGARGVGHNGSEDEDVQDFFDRLRYGWVVKRWG
ncbi:hypothetical protein PTSG_10674 [Salpingoeca rosetta]|uniref:Sulfotransferase domain-containing protein n=1 Tax=Salpingoeca rosetta (strain ATCC 50818 / BSB-021) TaxID=946362 RepID=F2UQ22_SALR5|nr:uncharacterized protein PTSG_10674 [Salpingoeca rosetta]EGD79690.1 hypothetical protein PTSG_10674 [Salpingoeca rosetta]|eukprot:XP_004988640.1 hypothetical protein PTSG_10674 [Salpingoeca rosetta]